MRTVRETGRWRGIAALALFAVAAGVLADRPALLLVGVVGAGYAVYPRLVGPPTVSLALEREVAESSPSRGEPVTVTTRLTNTGDRTLTDLRVLDGVPPMLTVAAGSPRHAAVLRPGATTEYSYEVEPDYGYHEFEPATVIARDPTGAHEVETTVSAGTELSCAGAVTELPVRTEPDGFAGRLVTDDGGSGLEFHSVREYRPGDPMGRIDAKRWARTGELTTVEFHEERSTAVVLLVDARPPAYRARAPERPNAVARSRLGVEQVLPAFADTRDRVGLAALGRSLCWEAPEAGSAHVERLRRVLQTDPAFSPYPPAEEECRDIDEQRRRLAKQLPATAQVVLFSPLTDDTIFETTRALAAAGHAVTVVSPDVTADGTLGQRFARRTRRSRLQSLGRAGVTVVDWDPGTPLGAVLQETSARRWSV